MSRLRRHLRRACVTAIAAGSALTLGVSTASAATGGLGSVPNFAPLKGSTAAGEVLDAANGSVVWQSQSQVALMPASTTKVATAIAALTVLGPAHTERTRAVLYGSSLYLVGGADQHLTGDDVNALADYVARALHGRHLSRVKLYVDDSLFPHMQPTSPGWQPGYVPGEISSISALQIFGHENVDSALYAGNVFRARLGTRGIHVQTGVLPRGTAPRAGHLLGYHTSLPLSAEVEAMLKDSINDNAEGFARLTALAYGKPAVWNWASWAVLHTLAGYHVPLGGVTLYDGSGLSRSDRMTAQALTSMLELAVNPSYQAKLKPLLVGLPIAGVDGTLGKTWGRFVNPPTNCAAGRIEAKTGTLTGAVTLAGVTLDGSGRPARVFAFLEQGSFNTTDARNLIDHWAANVEGCLTY